MGNWSKIGLDESIRLALGTVAEKLGGTRFTKYTNDPIAYVREILGSEPWAKQREILEGLNHYRARVAVKSCHASGKTWTGAAAASWFLNTGSGSVVLTTAPTARQVEEVFWREIREQSRFAKVPLLGTLLPRDPRWEISDKWFALGFSTDEPDRFQGFHATRILVIEDEASGVAPTIHSAVEGILSGGDARLLMIGNPTQVTGHFHAAFTSKRGLGGMQAFTISAFDTPNLTGEGDFPFLVSPDWVREKKLEWGEDSDLWRVRVLGEFPLGAMDTIISLASLDIARRRTLLPTEPLDIGVDVARYGDDRTVICGRAGSVVIDYVVLRQHDTVFVASRASELAYSWAAKLGIAPRRVRIKIDDSSAGGGVTDQLRMIMRAREPHERINIYPVNSAEKALDVEKYPNRRSEMWFATADRANDGDLDLSRLTDDQFDVLVNELTAPKWKPDTRGRRVAETKEDFKKRLKASSPDVADALNLAFAAPSPVLEPAAFAQGGARGWTPAAT